MDTLIFCLRCIFTFVGRKIKSILWTSLWNILLMNSYKKIEQYTDQLSNSDILREISDFFLEDETTLRGFDLIISHRVYLLL